LNALESFAYYFAKGLAESSQPGKLKMSPRKQRKEKKIFQVSPGIPVSDFGRDEDITPESLFAQMEAQVRGATAEPRAPSPAPPTNGESRSQPREAPDRSTFDLHRPNVDDGTYEPSRETDTAGVDTTLPWLGTR
jgi:hypothetical protein